MANIVGVKFSGNAKVYSFDSGELELAVGDGVIVETVKGLEYGTVAEAVRPAVAEDEKNPLKPVVRKATEKDCERVRRGIEQKPHALSVANDKIAEHNLPMKLVDCEYAFDGSKLIFYFTSETRVDFRDLVRDLASYFRMRIELRQIGIRDECKMLGGIAPCGRPCCCAAFLNEFTHVTVKMAKNQGLSLNPTKISGLCGRLMCCLQYENEHYVETGKRMPRIGSEIETPDGAATVLSDNMLKEEVRVRIPVKDGYEIRDYKLSDIGFEKAAIGSGSQKFSPKQIEEDPDDFFEFGGEAITAEEIVTETPVSAESRPRPPRGERGERDAREPREPNRRAPDGGNRNRGAHGTRKPPREANAQNAPRPQNGQNSARNPNAPKGDNAQNTPRPQNGQNGARNLNAPKGDNVRKKRRRSDNRLADNKEGGARQTPPPTES